MADDEQLKAGNPDIVHFLNSAPYSVLFMAEEPKAGRIDAEVLVPLYEAVTRGTLGVEAALKQADAKLTALLAE
jgi:hypothetical protein